MRTTSVSRGIRTRNPSKRVAADPRPRLHDHRNRRYIKLLVKKSFPRLYCTKILFFISFSASFPESSSINILKLYCKHCKYKNTLSNNSVEKFFISVLCINKRREEISQNICLYNECLHKDDRYGLVVIKT